MHRVAVIPCLSDSSRVPRKNTMLINGFPLVMYAVEACINSGAFHKVYVNTDNKDFIDLLKDYDCEVYLRDPKKGGVSCEMSNSSAHCAGGRCQVHDHFLMAFMGDISADYVFQVHTTSPLIEPEYIKEFVDYLCSSEDHNCLFAKRSEQMESFYKGDPLNFSLSHKQPTQSLTPVDTICWAISGWSVSQFKEGYKEGPTFYGNPGFMEIPKLQSLDIDNPEDIYMVEACLAHREKRDNIGKWFYNPEVVTGIEWELGGLIDKDGSPLKGGKPNQRVVSLQKAKEFNGPGSWCHPVIFTDIDQVSFIQQLKDEGCRKHFHPTKSEWWYILEGTFQYSIWDYKNEGPLSEDPDEVVLASSGDVVFLEKGKIHIITCVTDAGVRLACGGRNMSHVYVG